MPFSQKAGHLFSSPAGYLSQSCHVLHLSVKTSCLEPSRLPFPNKADYLSQSSQRHDFLSHVLGQVPWTSKLAFSVSNVRKSICNILDHRQDLMVEGRMLPLICACSSTLGMCRKILISSSFTSTIPLATMSEVAGLVRVYYNVPFRADCCGPTISRCHT